MINETLISKSKKVNGFCSGSQTSCGTDLFSIKKSYFSLDITGMLVEASAGRPCCMDVPAAGQSGKNFPDAFDPDASPEDQNIS